MFNMMETQLSPNAHNNFRTTQPFQQITMNKPQWAQNNNNNMKAFMKNTTSSTITTTTTIVSVDQDELFNQHWDNLSRNVADNDDIVSEEREEITKAKFSKLIQKANANKNMNLVSQAEAHNHQEIDDVIDQPQVFQVEDGMNNSIKARDDTDGNNKENISDASISIPPVQPTHSVPDNRENSVMPTPMAYSRCSSLTSLNSFDVKSVHSSVASEYSARPSQMPSPTKKPSRKYDYDEEPDDDDLDILMPESPAAQADSSFMMAQRIKHKQQQMHCRQSAAMAITSATAAATSTRIMTADSDKLWKPYGSEMNQIMSRFGMNQQKSIIEPELNVQSGSNMINYSPVLPMTSGLTNTPPVKLVQTANFAQLQQQQQQQQQIPVIQQLTQPAFLNQLPQPAVKNPMSMTYAFMKNHTQTISNPMFSSSNMPSLVPIQHQPSAPSQPSLPPVQSAQNLPKFLTSKINPTYNFMSQVPPVPVVPIIQNLNSQSSSSISSGSSTASSNPIKSPDSQIMMIDDDIPCVYSVESRFNCNTIPSSNPNINGNSSGPSSPQESMCSRMSEASVPSIIKQEISSTTKANIFNLLNTAASSAPQIPNPLMSPAPTAADFKAIFLRMNKNLPQPQLQSTQPLINQFSNNNMMFHNPNSHNNYEEPDYDQPKQYSTIEQDNQFSNNSINYYSNTPTNKPNYSPPQNYRNLSFNDYTPTVSNHRFLNSMQMPIENTINYHQRPVNTPAYIPPVNPTVQALNATDTANCSTGDITDYNMNEHRSVAESANHSWSCPPRNGDLDLDNLENFLKEMCLPPVEDDANREDHESEKGSTSSSSCSGDSVRTNKSSNTINKRASLQSLSSSSNYTIVQTKQPDQKAKAPIKPSKPIKRLSEDNSTFAKLNSTISCAPMTSKDLVKKPVTKIESVSTINKPKVSSTVSSVKTVTSTRPIAQSSTSSGPVVNMTKTSQLRASKLAATNTAVRKPLVQTNTKTIPSTSKTTTVPTTTINKASKSRDTLLKQSVLAGSTDKLNQTHAENSIPSSVTSMPVGQINSNFSNNNPRRKSFSFGHNTVTQVSDRTVTNSKTKEPAKSTNSTIKTTETTTKTSRTLSTLAGQTMSSNCISSMANAKATSIKSTKTTK